MAKLKLGWLYRLFQEPRKQIGQANFILSLLPKMAREELKNKKKRGYIYETTS